MIGIDVVFWFKEVYKSRIFEGMRDDEFYRKDDIILYIGRR